MNKPKSDYISWIFLLGIVVLIMEFSFFNRGLIFSLLVQAGMVYFGRKWMPRTIGKILFWVGLILLIISICSMMTFKFFLLAVLLHFIIKYAHSKRNPEYIRPETKEPPLILEKENIIRKKPLFSNQLFGQQKTPEHGYEWNDINIQTGIGDAVIDLSYTVLPKGEAVIFIRNIVGNIRILIPYDVEVSVNHTVIAGTAEIFELQETKIFNQVIQVHTPGFVQADQRIKIFTSLLVGNLEVKRI